MAIKISGETAINDTRKGTFRVLNVGTYTEATRPVNPLVGDTIYDSDSQQLLSWNGTEWA